MELRWYIEEWVEYRDGLRTGVKHTEKPVLQFRTIENPFEIGLQSPIWSEWQEVPTVYSEN